MSALSAVLSTRVRRRRRFGAASCTECTGQGNDFKLIPTLEMETRSLVEGYFGSEFPPSVIIAELWRPEVQDVKHFWDFLRFFIKTTHYGKICKILFRKFSSRHRSTCCVQTLWNLADGKSMKSCVDYLTKNNKISPGSLAVATARIALKIRQGQPPTMYSECSRFHPNRFTFGGVIAHRVAQ